MTRRENSDESAKRKMSSDLRNGDFHGVGTTIEERQNRLNAACALNMACGSPEVRQGNLSSTGRVPAFQPGTSLGSGEYHQGYESLIEKRRCSRTTIVDHGARVVMVGNAYRIESSATLP
jgi:hypothetical protein